LVGEAQRSRAPIQRLADVVASWFVPGVILIAGLTALGWWVFGPEPRLAHALANAVSVLIIACPCALGLATPMSIMVGTGRGAQGGVLVRNAEALERMEKIDTLVVDKTGTLTEGKPRLTKVVAAEGTTEEHVLQVAASLERGSEHPLAAALLQGARDRGIALLSVEGFNAVTGKGVDGKVDGRAAALGNARFADSLVQVPLAFRESADALRGNGETVVFLVEGGRVAGIIGV